MRTKVFRPAEPAPVAKPARGVRGMTEHAVLYALCLRIGIPLPVAEYRFHPTRKWRFDHAWPEYKVGLEKEGGIFPRKTRTGARQGAHGSVTGLLRDLEKYSEAAACGWLVIRSRADQWPSSVALERVRRAIQSRSPEQRPR